MEIPILGSMKRWRPLLSNWEGHNESGNPPINHEKEVFMKITEKMPIVNKLGLHLRAAAELVKVANKFKSHVMIHHGIQNVNAKSLMGIMTLAAAKGTDIEFVADGGDTMEGIPHL